MKDRQSVIGFTEAELGLVLALIFLALWIVTQAKVRPQRPGVVEVANGEIVALKDSATRVRDVAAALDAAHDSVRLLRDSIRGISNQTPRCIERGYSDRFLGTVTIRGPNDFEIDATRSDIDGVLTHFRDPLAWAEKHGCRHSVQVRAVPELAVKDFTPAFRLLREHFNTDIR